MGKKSKASFITTDEVSAVDDVPVAETTNDVVVDVPVAETTDDVVSEVPVAETTDNVVAEVPVAETADDVIVDVPIAETIDDGVVEVPVAETTDNVVAEVPVAETTDDVVAEVPVAETTDDVVAEVPVAETTDDVVVDDDFVSNDIMEEIRYEIEQELLSSVSVRLPILFIIPYRDRAQQQSFFSRHMTTIMANIPHKMLYVHQLDNREFNRGALKNIGFMVAKEMYPDDYKQMTLVFNDIDTMPLVPGYLDYETKSGIIKHFYGFQFTLGGIVSITGEDFERMNGFPNLWAWGYEDNELQARALRLGITIDRAQFHPFLDKNIIQLQDGSLRKVNKSEYAVYQSNTGEGIGSLSDVKYSYDEDTGFLNVSAFNTQREENISARSVHDLRNGNVPFPTPRVLKRAGAMKMFF